MNRLQFIKTILVSVPLASVLPFWTRKHKSVRGREIFPKHTSDLRPGNVAQGTEEVIRITETLQMPWFAHEGQWVCNYRLNKLRGIGIEGPHKDKIVLCCFDWWDFDPNRYRFFES